MQRDQLLKLARTPAEKAREQLKSAIAEVEKATWVEQGIRDRTLQMLRSGEHDTARILTNFQAISDKHKPAEVVQTSA